MSTSALAWHIARASGLVGWTVLATSTLWGLLLSTRLFGRRPRPAWLLDLHRFLGGLALVFTALHVGGILLDTTIDFGPASVLVPFASPWRPAAVAWGVAAVYLLLAVELTSLARRHLSHRLWRRVHVLAFPLFLASTVHGLAAGSDTGGLLVGSLVALTTVAVASLTAVRVLKQRPGQRPVRPTTTVAA